MFYRYVLYISMYMQYIYIDVFAIYICVCVYGHCTLIPSSDMTYGLLALQINSMCHTPNLGAHCTLIPSSHIKALFIVNIEHINLKFTLFFQQIDKILENTKNDHQYN